MIFYGNSIAVDERSRCDQRWGWSFLKMIKLMTNDPYRMSCEKCRTMGEQYSIVKPRRAGASEESFWKMPAWPHSSTPQSTPAAAGLGCTTFLVGQAPSGQSAAPAREDIRSGKSQRHVVCTQLIILRWFFNDARGMPQTSLPSSLARSVSQLVNEWKTRKVTGFHLHHYVFNKMASSFLEFLTVIWNSC